MRCTNPECRSGRRNQAVAVTGKAGKRGGVAVCAGCVTAYADLRDDGDPGIKIFWLVG
jgi:hypothetical protein